MAERVCVGAIAGAFGVRGEVRLKSFCAVPEDIASYGPLSLEDGSRSFTVKLTASVKGGFAARLEGIATKEDIDKAMKLGANFPKGPFEMAEEYGMDTVKEKIKELEEKHGECYSVPKMLQ